jgi:4-amino-4-deoxy-L-arabinose transferase-like glycosyltransferase
MKKTFLAIILLLGFLLRIIALDKFPVGFTPDEASFGYDAYSILKTGKDQWGKTLPLVFESFGDYKSPLYAYLTVPSVATFGLNKFSVRLPNAVIGTLAIYAVYLLVGKLVEKKGAESDLMATFAALLLAISPWHIMMSRGAFEANLTTFLLPLSLYFFFKSFEKPKNLILSVIFVGLNIFSYHSAKFVTPLVFLAAILIYRRRLFNNFGIYHKVSIGLVLIFIVLFAFSLKAGSSTRIFDVSIFKTSLLEASSERIKAINEGMNPLLARFVYNKYQAGIRHFVGNYITYFSPQFYFSQGPGESTYGMVPGRGVLYWFELPLVLLGFMYLLKNISNRSLWIIVVWFLLSPIPAALSTGPGYAANRAVVALPSIQIICATGLYYLIGKMDSLKYKRTVLAAFGVSVFMFLGYFMFNYFVLSPQNVAKGMLYGNYEALDYVAKNYNQRSVTVSRRLSEPHIYVAFINKWDPADYQENSKLWNYKNLNLGWVDQMPEYRLGNYLFKNINYSEYANENTLLVGRPDEFPASILFDKLFSYPDGEKAVVIVDTINQKYAWKN